MKILSSSTRLIQRSVVLVSRPSFLRLEPIALNLVPSAILVLIGSIFFPSSGRDDAHITYWAAYSLSHFGEILNYNGNRVEQSSSLLHVVLLAITAFVTKIDIVSLGKSSSILFGAASLVALQILTKKVEPKAPFLAAVLTGTSVYFAYWSFGGLETTLTTLTSLLLILTYGSYLNKQGSYFTGMAWVTAATFIFALARPEMPVVLICMVLGAILSVLIFDKFNPANHAQHQKFLLHLLTVLGISLITISLIIGFRILYFDSPFPQPVVAKSNGLSFNILRLGIIYLKQQLIFSLYIKIIAVSIAFSIGYVVWTQLRTKQVDPYILLSVLFLVTYISFIIFSGGDWMEGGRFLVHLLPIAMIFPSLVLGHLLNRRAALVLYQLKSNARCSERSKESSRLNIIDMVLFIGIPMLIGIQMAAVVDFTERSLSLPVWNRIELQDEFVSFPVSHFELMNRPNIRDIPVIHHLDIILDRLYLSKVTNIYIMSGQMGMVPYHIFQQHFGRVRMMDHFGLADRTFTNCEVTSNLKKSTFGLELDYKFYFNNRKSLEETCGIARPDIILDIHWRDAELAHENGYTVIYSQSGQMNSEFERLTAHTDDEFIAVRDDLVPALGEIKQIHLDVNSLLKRK
jgi:hypothetical protein